VERPGYFKTISSAFVFIAAFLAVSNYLGGGGSGITAAAFMAIVVTMLYFLFYGWIVRLPSLERLFRETLKERPSPEKPMRTRRTEAPNRILPPELATGLGGRTSKRKPSSSEARGVAKIGRPAPGLGDVCDPGPYDVESGSRTKISLSVLAGQNVTGLLEEVDDYDFSYMIIDEENWALCQQEREFDVADQADGESTYKIDWFVESDGPWSLVLEAYGKQIIREVEVKLRMGPIGR